MQKVFTKIDVYMVTYVNGSSIIFSLIGNVEMLIT